MQSCWKGEMNRLMKSLPKIITFFLLPWTISPHLLVPPRNKNDSVHYVPREKILGHLTMNMEATSQLQ